MQQTNRTLKFPPLFMLCLAVFVATIGCGINGPKPSNETFDFKFDSESHGWQGGFVDLPVNAGDTYQLVYEPFKQLPTELGTGSAPFIQSQNLSDDVFMFIKKQVTGLTPNTNYIAYFEVVLATNVPANSVGIGGPPGESVYVKAGGSPQEPQGIVETVGNEDYYRLNVDKGNQSTSGNNAVILGNVAKTNGDASDQYQAKLLTNANRYVAVRTDENGSAWIFVGTDSAFEGLTQLYYKSITVRFE